MAIKLCPFQEFDSRQRFEDRPFKKPLIELADSYGLLCSFKAGKCVHSPF